LSLKFGQGIRFGGRCLWQEQSDYSVSANLTIDNYVVVVTAYLVKINQDSDSDSSDSEEADD
jgi:hypothetical protein